MVQECSALWAILKVQMFLWLWIEANRNGNMLNQSGGDYKGSMDSGLVALDPAINIKLTYNFCIWTLIRCWLQGTTDL